VAAQQQPLKDTFKNDFMIGAALNRRQIFEQDARAAAIVTKHFNSITPENILKWALVHPEPGRYDFAASDRFVEFGEKHRMFVVGHTLVWHNQTPRWVFEDEKGNAVDRETLLNRMREHIFTVVGRYKGRIKGWDVVNEALNQDGTMRQSPWFKIIGDDYLVKAFQFAHEADPSAQLYYNDYDLELPAKRAGGVELIKKLKAAGVPISGVGLQNHNLMDWPSAADEDATITAFENLGVKIHITELDVDVLPRTTKPGADYAVDIQVTPQLNPYVDRLPDARQLALTRRYLELFQVYLKHRDAIDRVTFWGVSDGDSWLNNWPMKGRTNYPLLFDRFGRAKPALAAIINLKSGSWFLPAELTAEPSRAWAWGASRALDYFETDKTVDAKRVGLEGHSRYGKAALVAMAYDQRFAIAYISSSGAAGAKLHRRNWGELVENIASSGEYHWNVHGCGRRRTGLQTFGKERSWRQRVS
jgi:endo-1,4-beta-xylanase